MIRVGVVAAPLALRAGLRALLSAPEDIQVVAEAAGLSELSAQAAGIDVFVVAAGEDLLPELNIEIEWLEPAAALFLVSDETSAAQILSGLRWRVWGLLPLEAGAEELLAAVRALREGLLVGAPSLVGPFIRRLTGGPERLIEPLTGRETQVLQLLAQGLGNKQIAAELGISEHTVKFHVSAVYAKVGAANRAEAVRQGIHQGLIVL